MKIIEFTYKKPSNLTYLTIEEVDSIALHHFAADSSIHSVTEYHMNIKKWDWVGYGYIIDSNGTIYEARGYKYINAGVEDNNSHIISIALQGNFDVYRPKQEQFSSLTWLINYLKSKIPTIKYVDGHRKWNNTSCPGTKFPLIDFREAPGVLKFASEGKRVKQLQTDFNTIGYNLEVDGIFGIITEDAVKYFQRGNGLNIDGIVGENTSKVIEAMINKLKPNKKKYSIEELTERLQKVEKFLSDELGY